MSPIRRYLRITKYSVLEVRIYLDKPSDIPWLLSSHGAVLPRVIEEIRPKVLPKLREENENAKKKGGKKKKAIKDMASQEDFEVTIFLTELSTRHSLLTKKKQFIKQPRLKSTSSKLCGWLSNNNDENPIHILDDDGSSGVLQENAGEVLESHEIPEVEPSRRRSSSADENNPLFVSSDDGEFFQTQKERTKKRRRLDGRKTDRPQEEIEQIEEEDKKKLALSTSYEGFSIYGRILCLVVKRKGKKAQPASHPVGGSQMMEQWVSTQAAQEAGLDENDEG